MIRAAVGLLLLMLATNGLCADGLDAAARLAQADGYLQEHDAGRAVDAYRGFVRRYPDHPRADYAMYMVGESCGLAMAQLAGLVPADLFTEFNPDSKHYRLLAQHLAVTYGMYAELTEGDSRWYYDMRAYRELLKRYPSSEYADDCRYLLVGADAPRGWAIGMGPAVARTARASIAEYESILREYPDTNRRDDIEEAIAGLREIEAMNAPTDSAGVGRRVPDR